MYEVTKSHCFNEVCVGASKQKSLKREQLKPLAIKAMGYGKQQIVNVDAHGFRGENQKWL